MQIMTNVAEQVEFQSTLPRGSDCRQSAKSRSGKRFQSTLPRGSDLSCWIISQELKEFQSTLPRGSDIALSSNISSVNEFQSTLPRGSDDNLCPSNLLHCIISIHAPSRERLKTFSMRSQNSIFQSTLPRGSDSFEHFVTSFVQRFQSTLPRGSDYKPNLGALAISYFNPRSLAGATII